MSGGSATLGAGTADAPPRAPSTRAIVRAIADAAARWTDADFPARVRATRAAVDRTGYSEPVVDYAFDRLFGGITRDALETTIADELGSLDALEHAVARPGRPAVAYRGVARVAIVASDTTLGVAIVPLVFALCARARVAVKDRADGLVAAFAQTLAEELPELGAAVSAEPFAGADVAAMRSHVGNADVVVAFGRDDALAAIRSLLRPGARFVPFGHATSVGYLPREALADDASALAVARDVARDALLYDGDGCLSSHAIFVERGALDPERVALLLARACEAAAIEFPSARPPDARLLAYRNRLAFRAAQGDGAVHAGASGAFVLAVNPPRDEPPPLLPRALALYTVDGPHDALAFARAHALPLAAWGTTSPPRPDVLAAALAAGAARVARLGALQDPPLGGEHGGEGRILPFVRAVAIDA